MGGVVPGKKGSHVGDRQVRALLRNIKYKYIIGQTSGPLIQCSSTFLSHHVAEGVHVQGTPPGGTQIVKPNARHTCLKHPLSLLPEKGHQKASG